MQYSIGTVPIRYCNSGLFMSLRNHCNVWGINSTLEFMFSCFTLCFSSLVSYTTTFYDMNAKTEFGRNNTKVKHHTKKKLERTKNKNATTAMQALIKDSMRARQRSNGSSIP